GVFEQLVPARLPLTQERPEVRRRLKAPVAVTRAENAVDEATTPERTQFLLRDARKFWLVAHRTRSSRAGAPSCPVWGAPALARILRPLLPPVKPQADFLARGSFGQLDPRSA